MGASPTTDMRFRRIFDEHYASVARYCLRRLPNADANDACAEVFLVAWKKIDKVPAGEEALPWLYATARNVVRNVERSHRRSGRLYGRLGGLAHRTQPGPESQVVRRNEDEALLAALSSLSEGDQEVLRLRAYEELTAPDIAVALGISPEAAKKRLARALKRLGRVATPIADPSPHPRAIPEGGER